MTAAQGTPSAVVIGNALIDEIRDATGTTTTVGGAGLNLAAGLSADGVKAHLVASLGHDAAGERLRSTCDRLGITIEEQPVLPATSVVASWIGGPDPEYNFSQPVHRGASFTPAVLGSIAQADAVVVNVFPFEDDAAVEHLRAALASATGIRIVDPNPRPQLLEDPGHFVRNLEELLAVVDILKLSTEDLRLLGSSTSLSADALLHAGPALVFLTKGAKGAIVRDVAHQEIYEPAAPIDTPVVDTIGAGDAALAGLTAALLHESALRKDVGRRDQILGADLRRCVRVAMQRAAACCTHRGGSANGRLAGGEHAPAAERAGKSDVNAAL